MIITEFQAENFKRLVAVHIRPDGSIVELTGANEQGKTSILDGIEAALRGAGAIPEVPIRVGAESGDIRLVLGKDREKPELIVERRFTAGGSRLVVTNGEGFKAPEPQAVLNKLVGTVSLDPLRFLDQTPKERSETVRRLLSIDVSDLEARHKDAYERRTEISRRGRDLRVVFDRLPAVPEDTPDEPVDVTALSQRAQEARETEQRVRLFETELNRFVAHKNEIEERRRKNQLAIEDLRRQIEAFMRQIESDGETLSEVMEELDQLNSTPREKVPDVSEILDQIAAATATNHNVAMKKQRAETEEKLSAARTSYDEVEAELVLIAEERRNRFLNTPLPVEKLKMAEDGALLYQDLPLEQASAAAQLRVSIEVAAALAPNLKVICVRDGSRLDSKARAWLATWAEGRGYQVWLERVDESGEIGIVIEEGRVVGAPEPVATEKKGRKAK